MIQLPRTALLALTVLILAPGALAQDLTTTAGLTLTTDYDGDDTVRPALQGFVETEFGWGGYAGLWASSLAPDTGDRVEVNLYLGYRGEAGPVSYDLSYTRFVFDSTGDCCGEAALLLELDLNDMLRPGIEFAADFEGGTSITPQMTVALPYDFEAVFEYGFDTGSSDREWAATLSRPLGEHVTLALDYWDSNTEDPRAAISIAFDTGIFKR